MIKTIKPGNPVMAIPWYLREPWPCTKCEGIYEATDRDDVKWDYPDQRSELEGDRSYGYIVCPDCKTQIRKTGSQYHVR